MSKVFYWLKLKKDFFTNKAMKKLRKIAGGDTYTVIYLKLMLSSLNDEGFLYYEGVEPTFSEEIALALDEDAENVKVTLTFLESVGLLENKGNNEYFLTQVPYLIGSETDKAELMRRKRQRERLENGNNVTKVLPDVTKRYTEIEKEIDIETEKEKETEIEVEQSKTPYQLIVDMYNDTCVSFPRVKSLSDMRKAAIRARLKRYTIEDFRDLFTLAESSDFLKGSNAKNWSATFDWLIKDSNFAKVLDGNYNNKDRNGNNAPISDKARELEAYYKMDAEWAMKGELNEYEADNGYNTGDSFGNTSSYSGYGDN